MNGNPKQQPKSREYDFFPTHPLWTQALLDVERFTGTISEPCAGDGAMVKVLTDAGYSVDASDIRDYGAGYRVQNAFEIRNHENVVTNPPFNVAEDLIRHWLSTTSGRVAVLMRAQFLEGQARYQNLFGRNPPTTVVLIPERMPVPLTGQSGQFNHAWIVWDRENHSAETRLVWSSTKSSIERLSGRRKRTNVNDAPNNDPADSNDRTQEDAQQDDPTPSEFANSAAQESGIVLVDPTDETPDTGKTADNDSIPAPAAPEELPQLATPANSIRGRIAHFRGALVGALLGKLIHADRPERFANHHRIEGVAFQIRTISGTQDTFTVNPPTEPHRIVVAAKRPKESTADRLCYALFGVLKGDAVAHARRSGSRGHARSAHLQVSLGGVRRTELGKVHIPLAMITATSADERVRLLDAIDSLTLSETVGLADEQTIENIKLFILEAGTQQVNLAEADNGGEVTE